MTCSLISIKSYQLLILRLLLIVVLFFLNITFYKFLTDGTDLLRNKGNKQQFTLVKIEF